MGSIIESLVTTVLLIINVLLAMQVDAFMAIWISLPLYVIGFTLFAASLSIRRLHDLNKSGYLFIILLPGFIIAFFNIGVIVSGSLNNITPALNVYDVINKNALFSGFYKIYYFISQIFGLYLWFWPGTKANNKYGPPSRHWELKEIFLLAKPGATTANKPTQKVNIVKLMVKMIIGGVIFIVALVIIAFSISFIRGYLHI